MGKKITHNIHPSRSGTVLKKRDLKWFLCYLLVTENSYRKYLIPCTPLSTVQHILVINREEHSLCRYLRAVPRIAYYIFGADIILGEQT